MHVVGEAEDYSTTIKLIQDFSPQVVLLDIAMPDLNGWKRLAGYCLNIPGSKLSPSPCTLTVCLS